MIEQVACSLEVLVARKKLSNFGYVIEENGENEKTTHGKCSH